MKSQSSAKKPVCRPAELAFIASFTEAVTVRPFLSDLLALRRQRAEEESVAAA